MKRLMVHLGVLGLWAVAVLPVSAGWDNVFQPTLFHRWRQPSTSGYYAPPVIVQSSPIVAHAAPVVAHAAPCDACPQQACNTTYSQRCYYQPVTTYENRTVYESVTTYRTSYYHEPVTSYRYSCYYDPCTCSYQQVAVPTTTYQLRAQNCPVQSWVARCVQVPVTTQQKVCYWQPQTTCCTTTQGAPIFSAAPPPVSPAPPLINAVPGTPPAPPSASPGDRPPSISGTHTPGMSAPKSTLWEQYYPPIEKSSDSLRMNPGPSSQPRLGAPVPIQPTQPQPPVKLDRIAVGSNSQVEGQVTRSDNSPRPNAKVLFINAGTGQRQSVFANSAGRFRVDLPAGSWHVYLHGADDMPIHHSRIDVNGAQTRQVNLVSRTN